MARREMWVAKFFWAAALLFVVCGPSWGQGVVGDLLGGKLIDPDEGQWIWYSLSDNRGESRYAIRQAIVGEERVDGDKGYWVEFEVVPEIGFKSIYKVLLTGPARDPENIHRIIVKQGMDPARVVPVDKGAEGKQDLEGRRESLGMDTVATGDGPIRAEHLRVKQENRTIELWVNDDIRPTGIVKLKTPDGQMVLSRYGSGGEYGESVLDETPIEGFAPPKPDVEVRTPNEGTTDSAEDTP